MSTGRDITYKEAIAEDGGTCLPCKIIGSAAFIGLGGYVYYSGFTQLELRKEQITNSNSRFGVGIRRLGVHGTALGLIGLGMYRYFGVR